MKSTLLQNIIKQTVLIGTIFHINIFAVLSGFITEDTTFTIENSPYRIDGDVWLIKLKSEINTGLVAYYPFNGNANDESGNGNDGIIYGASLTTDRFGNENSACKFNGESDYIEVNHEERLDIQKFTVAAWVRYNLGSVNKAGVFNNGYTVDHYALCADSSGITIWANWPASNNVGVMYLSHVLRDENFHFLTATYDGQNRGIWIDGEKVLERNFTEVIDYSTSEKCYIGANFPGSDEFFKGDIDDIRIYNRALPESEIDSLYHLGGWVGQVDSNLIAYYPFNGNASDESGNGNDGTVNGVALTSDRFGNENSAYYFDGNDDYIDLTNEFDMENKTVIVWFNLNDQRINYSNIYVSDNPTLQYGNTRLRTSENNELLYASGGYGRTVNIDQNVWYMATICKSGYHTFFYLNDILLCDSSITYISSDDGHETTYLGTDRRTSFRYFDGIIDDVSIYSKSLNGSEIDSIYHIGGWDLPSEPGLVAYYPFNGNANDESGNDNDGIVYGATLTTDRFGSENSAYSFDGVNDCIDLGSGDNDFHFESGEDFSIAAWIKINEYKVDYHGIFGRWYEGATDKFYYTAIRNSLDKLYFRFQSIPYLKADTSNTAVELNQWHHVVFVFDRDQNATFYLNSKNDGSINISEMNNETISNPSANVYIGQLGGDIGFLSGKLDDIRVYNRVLAESEIDSLYHIGGWDDTISPSAPLNLSVEEEYRKITLHWSQNTETDLSKYNIYRDTLSPAVTFIDSVTGFPPDTFYFDTGLTNGQIYYYRITAVDEAGNESDFSDEVSAIPGDYIRPEIQILNPTEGFSIPEYELLTTTWNATDNIALESFVVSYTDKPGAKLRGISIVPAESSQCSFHVPAGVTDSAMVWVKGRDTSGNDTIVYSPHFSVTDNTPPDVDLLTLFSDSSFEIMSTRSIFWAASDNVAIQSIDIVYSINAGDTWISISENEPNDGEYSWLIPNTPSEQCKIKITATDSVGLSDEAISDGLFTIYVTYPKLISHSTIISALDTIQLGFSQTLNTEQFSTGLALSSAIEENLTYDLQFLNNDQDVYIYPENSFVSGDTISLILSADQITNAYGYGLDGNQNDVFEGSPLDNDTVTVYVNYSGDFDGNDQVDFDDLALFANGWYSKDYKYELGPVTGDIPHFITMTDSLFNIEDAMTFGRMWNWFVGIGKHVITMPQLSLGGGFTIEQNGNDLIIHSRASAGKRIVLQYDPEIITINKKQQSLSKPTDLTFEFYADCLDSNRSEYVHYSFNEELSNVPVIFTIKSKQRDPFNIIIGVESIDETGELVLSDVITTLFQPIPDKFEVFPNYPNPFNSQTVIEYAIPVQSDVLINIYDLLGRKVKTLTNNRHEAKYYTLIWDGKDEQGRLAASGLYFLRITARTESKSFIKTKKMVMLR